MTVDLTNEQVQIREVELRNVVALVNAVLNQISAEYRSALVSEVAMNPALDAFYRAAAGEAEALQAVLEDADDRLRRELAPEEAADRLDEIALNCELRVRLVETTRDTLDGLRAGGQPALGVQELVDQVVTDFRAELRDLALDAVALCDRPAQNQVEVVSAELTAALATMDRGQENWTDLDAASRLCTVAAQWADQSPQVQLSAMKGAVMEELVGVLGERRAVELGSLDPSAKYCFLPAGSLADRTGEVFGALGDGCIARLTAEGARQVIQVFEAKAGAASARELHHRKGSSTEHGREEARAVLAEAPEGPGVVSAERMDRRREATGQLESTKGRLDHGVLFVNGERWMQDNTVQVVGCVPQDVAPSRGELLRVALSAAEVTAVSQRVLDAYSAARADDERRRAAE